MKFAADVLTQPSSGAVAREERLHGILAHGAEVGQGLRYDGCVFQGRSFPGQDGGDMPARGIPDLELLDEPGGLIASSGPG